MQVIKTNPGDANFQLFESLPALLYTKDSLRLKQSDTINQEWVHSCWVVVNNQTPIARAVLYNNQDLRYNNLKAVCIGNYECENNETTAAILLSAIEQQAKNLGADYIMGPMNGSTWDNYRFSEHHEHPNFLLEPWQHLYYNNQFIQNKFETIARYVSCIDKKITCNQPEVLELEKQFTNAKVKIRSIDMSNYEGELQKLYPFITNAFKTNFLYTPITWETFRKKYLEAAPIINPEYVLIAENEHGDCIGFIFSYDDKFNQQEKSLVIKTIARNPDKKWAGLGHVLANNIIRLAKQKNHQSIIHAFMLEQGTSSPVSKKFMGEVYKNYALYGKKI